MLLFEKSDALWSLAQLRLELEGNRTRFAIDVPVARKCQSRLWIELCSLAVRIDQAFGDTDAREIAIIRNGNVVASKKTDFPLDEST
mgnify:CR=1 FL=1